MRHRDDVEDAVRRTLHRHLVPDLPEISWEAYLKYDIEGLLHSECDANTLKDRLAYFSLFRKWKGYENIPDLDPTRASATSWLDAERLCAKTNRRLISECASNSYSIDPAILARACHITSEILGRFEFSRISELCRFGSGATFDKKRGTDHCQKLVKPSVTMSAIPWLCRAMTDDVWLNTCIGGLRKLQIVDCNRLVTVPKSAKTHRAICAEPTLNGFIQQGFGRYIRQRLKRFGVDLNDQTVNQDLARVALESGLATIDLASASDTLCVELCRLLLPREWFEALHDLRCPVTQIGHRGRRFLLNKFSSMGNAFTFELESLIFYALCRATVGCSNVVSVYGDDIIVPNDRALDVIKTLNWAGFKVNNEKSFMGNDRYRESCGRHYFDGSDVTPAYQKEKVRNSPAELVRFHNRLIRAGIRLDRREAFEDAARVVRDYARDSIRGHKRPGVGPLVEYDEYFIKENYSWPDDVTDRVEVMSVITVSTIQKRVGTRYNMTYLGRKLRLPEHQNPDPTGHASDVIGNRLRLKAKFHWRSATQVALN